MTDQELFDTVTTHLLTQNARSVGNCGDCRYYGTNGRKCAIGCLIPEDKYVPSMEGAPIDSREIREATGITTARQVDLAIQLQDVHDAYGVKQWRDTLQKVANHYELTFKEA